MPRLLIMLMLLTVLGAQVCGMQRGYLCEDHHTTEQSCPEHEEHAPLKEELQADQTVQIAVLAPLAVLTPILDFSVVLKTDEKAHLA
ncbi:MAG: hypothetical protein IPK32_26690 [Verrucomicrobiaceae bacterium]|nr:hypothetical protein [Verrucomicrobiaceae bacterium]